MAMNIQSGPVILTMNSAAPAITLNGLKARIYGAAQSFAERLLVEFNPKMPVATARQKAASLYEATKGKEILSVDDSGGYRVRCAFFGSNLHSRMPFGSHARSLEALACV
jgi:hypothetical protein